MINEAMFFRQKKKKKRLTLVTQLIYKSLSFLEDHMKCGRQYLKTDGVIMWSILPMGVRVSMCHRPLSVEDANLEIINYVFFF